MRFYEIIFNNIVYIFYHFHMDIGHYSPLLIIFNHIYYFYMSFIHSSLNRPVIYSSSILPDPLDTNRFLLIPSSLYPNFNCIWWDFSFSLKYPFSNLRNFNSSNAYLILAPKASVPYPCPQYFSLIQIPPPAVPLCQSIFVNCVPPITLFSLFPVILHSDSLYYTWFD